MTNSGVSTARDRSQNSDSDNDTSHSPEEPPMVPRATHLKALADKDVIEEAIRREADPRGLYRRSTIDTAGLVKSIRKRHRDGMEEHRREKEAMRIEREDLKRGFEDEKGALSNIIRHQNQARDEEGLNIRDENHELRSKNQKLLQESESKDQSVKELTEEKEALVKTCQEITEGSLVSLRIADRQMNHRIVRLTSKHEDELAEIRGWCSTLQERLAIARRLQPAIVLHRAQVGTVCEMHAKLVDLKKAKKEELAAKDREHAVLRTRNGQQEREIRDLKTMAEADGEVLEKTAGLLSDTRKKLNGAEDKIENQRREVKNLNQCGRAWETAYRAKDKEYTALKSEMGTLEANQRMELIRAEAQSGALEVKIDSLGTANDNMKKELESWENGHRGILGVSEPKHIETPPDLKSLVMALKAANTRADALQISANALQAENGALKRWLETATSASIMQVQEPVERLQSENSSLREAAEKATVLETQLTARLAEAEQKLGKRFEDRTRELEDGFNQGFENLRELREQWLLQKRGLEEQHNRDMIAEDLRCEIERQSREDQMMATLRKREENLQHNEDDLQSREAKLADEVKYVANPQSDEDAKEVSMLATEVSEASSLLQEIESSCVVQGSVGQNVLRELNKAKSALHRVKTELRNPQSVARRNHFLTMVSGANMNEQHIQQLNTATQAVLVRQAKEASARLQNLQKILDANEDVQKEAMLGALNAPNPFHRATKNARGLKRHTQPGSSMIPSSSSTGAQAGASMGQSQQTNNNAEQQYDPRPLDSQQNVQPQFPAASPQDQIQGLAPPRFSGATNGSTLPTQANASQYTPSTGSRFGKRPPPPFPGL